MNRIIVPSGSKVNFESTINELQDISFSNLRNRIALLLQSHGILISNPEDDTSSKEGEAILYIESGGESELVFPLDPNMFFGPLPQDRPRIKVSDITSGGVVQQLIPLINTVPGFRVVDFTMSTITIRSSLLRGFITASGTIQFSYLGNTVTNGTVAGILGAGSNTSGTDLKVSFASNNAFKINPGKGITSGGDYLSISKESETINPITAGTDDAWAVLVQYSVKKVDPVKALNYFVFDALGGSKVNQYTREKDSYTFKVVPIATAINVFRQNLPQDTILLAIAYRDESAFDPDPISSFPAEKFGHTILVDMRSESQMYFNADLFPEDIFFLKDRDSVGPNKVTGIVEFGNTVRFTDDVYLDSFLIKDDTGTLKISAGLNDDILTLSPDGILTTKELYADEVLINTGSTSNPIWEKAATIRELDNNITNFRLVGIAPNLGNLNHEASVQFKWNWDKLQIVGGGLSTTTVSIVGDSDLFTSSEIDEIVATKKLYFVASENEYPITGVTFENPNWLIEVTGNPSGENGASECRIIDDIAEIDGYVLYIDSSNPVISPKVYYLDSEWIYNPSLTSNLELKNVYSARLKTYSGESESSYSVMPAGSFIHSGNQVNYASPFTVEFPEKSLSGSITLVQSLSGFTLEINGFGYEGSDPDLYVHKFEVVYSPEPVNIGVMDNLNAKVTRKILDTGQRVYHATSDKAQLIYVGVRPLQNGEPVSGAMFGQVYSGSAGSLNVTAELFSGTVNVKYVPFESLGGSDSYKGYTIIRPFQERIFTEELLASLKVKKFLVIPEGTQAQPSFDDVVVGTSQVIDGTTIHTSKFSYGGTNFLTVEMVNPTAVNLSATTARPEGTIDNPTSMVIPGKSAVAITGVVALPNWGPADVEIVLYDVTGSPVEIDSFAIKRKTKSPNINGNAYRFLLEYINNSSDSIPFMVGFRGAGSFDYAENPLTGQPHLPTNPTNSRYGTLFIPYSWEGDYPTEFLADGTVRINWGVDPSPFKVTITSSENLESNNMPFTDFIYSSVDNLLHVKFTENVVPKGRMVALGASKGSRLIAEVPVQADTDITGLWFEADTVQNVSGADPGIIRVYNKGRDSEAAMIEIDGQSDSYQQAVNLFINTLNESEQRILVIDAFDPSTDNPNNRSTMDGRLVVSGKVRL